MTIDEIQARLLDMPERSARRGCEVDACACMGCANKSEGLRCSKEEYREAFDKLAELEK